VHKGASYLSIDGVAFLVTGKQLIKDSSRAKGGIIPSQSWLDTLSLWVLLAALQQHQALVSTALLQEARSQPPAKRINGVGLS